MPYAVSSGATILSVSGRRSAAHPQAIAHTPAVIARTIGGYDGVTSDRVCMMIDSRLSALTTANSVAIIRKAGNTLKARMTTD